MTGHWVQLVITLIRTETTFTGLCHMSDGPS